MTPFHTGGFVGKIPWDRRSEGMTPVRAAIGERQDEFVYTQEMATIEQIDALKAFLSLPAAEGFHVDFPEEE
jgi:hypothetical protein